MADSKQAAPERAVTSIGVNHLVLNVRDIEESHKFWTEIVGMQQVGALQPGTQERPRPVMRFYSADHGGKLNHHDIALVENKDLPPRSKDWAMFGAPVAVNHIAIALPGREAWLKQLAFLQSRGVKFERRVNHGMTRSLYISDPNGYGVELLYELPRDMWEGDIDAALNYAENLPTEGEAALVDEIDKAPSFGPREKAAAAE
jgi:catechol-2,3-dioxygenase